MKLSISVAKKSLHALPRLGTAHENPNAVNFSFRTTRLRLHSEVNAALCYLLGVGGKIRRPRHDLRRRPTEICRLERPLNEANPLGLASANHIAAEDDPRRDAFATKTSQTLCACAYRKSNASILVM
jgi:hypothetical protein